MKPLVTPETTVRELGEILERCDAVAAVRWMAPGWHAEARCHQGRAMGGTYSLADGDDLASAINAALAKAGAR